MDRLRSANDSLSISNSRIDPASPGSADPRPFASLDLVPQQDPRVTERLVLRQFARSDDRVRYNGIVCDLAGAAG